MFAPVDAYCERLDASFWSEPVNAATHVAGLLAIALFLRANARPGWRVFLLGVLVFCVSLALRTIDLEACPILRLGTHFLWHLLNAVVLFLLSRELVNETTRARPG